MAQTFTSFGFDDLFEVVMEDGNHQDAAPSDIISQYFDVSEA